METMSRDLPPWGWIPYAPPAHGTILAWARGGECGECRDAGEAFLFDVWQRRRRLRLHEL